VVDLGGSTERIVLVNSDGSGLQNLVQGRDPSWSPDGTRIAFRTGNADRPGGNPTSISVIDTDGSDEHALDIPPSVGGEASGEAGPAVWSPDGSQIAFGTLLGIYVMRPDGSDLHRVSRYEGPMACYDLEPNWSPDGERIVFADRCDGGEGGLSSMNADGSGRTQLLSIDNQIQAAAYPAFSPDGRQIVFAGVGPVDGPWSIYVMDADGSRVRKAAGPSEAGWPPTWSADGSMILFTQASTGVLNALEVATGSVHTIHTGLSYSCCAAWQPIAMGAPPTSTLSGALRATQLSVPSVFGVATTAEDVWLASYGHVLRVDLTDKLIASVPVPGLGDQDSIAASDSVWVTVENRDEVIEIDPTTNAIMAAIPVPGHPVQIAADPSGVWVISATKGPGILVRIDPMTRTVTLRVPLSSAPKLGLAVGEGSAWVDDGGNLLRVTSDGTRTTLPGAGGNPVAIGDGSVWEGNSSGVIRLDPASGDVLAQIPTALPPIGLAFADGSLWVLTDTGSTSETIYLPDPKRPSTVLRIDAVTNRVDAGPLAVGTSPAWIAASGADAWVANFNETRLLKIEESRAQ
jgi:TolB protein